jgi:hypothetical protein
MAQTEDDLQCIVDFLLHPTVLEQGISVAKPDCLSTAAQGKAATTTMAPAAFGLIDESIFHFWPTYTSDEEAASPLNNNNNNDDDDDDDHSSQYSRTASFCSDMSMPDLLADLNASDDAPHCKEAQTVVIQSAGRAKMVCMPKIVDVSKRSLSPSSSSSSGPVTPVEATSRPAIILPPPGSARSSQDSRTASSRNNSISSVVPLSPASTAPSSLYDDFDDPPLPPPQLQLQRPALKHKRRISRHVDLMQAALAISSSRSVPSTPLSPTIPRSASSFGDFPPSIRRKSKFGSSFAFPRISKTFALRRDTTTTVDDLEIGRELEPPSAAQQHVAQPKRFSSGRPKLVARGANERASLLVLPPFPCE